MGAPRRRGARRARLGVPLRVAARDVPEVRPGSGRSPGGARARAADARAYREVAELLPLGRYLAITVFVATAVATTQVVLAPAGCALAKKRFAGARRGLRLRERVLARPPHVTFVPVFLGLARVGLVDTLAALVVPFASSALATFLVRQAMLRVPDAVVEAARLDGAGSSRSSTGCSRPWCGADARRRVPARVRRALRRLLLAPRHDDG